MNAARRYAFGASGLADNVISTFLGVHLFVYYTDVVGLGPLYVSAGLTLALLWNAVGDFVMGRISDGTRWASGRRRPYILLGALPVGLGFVLLLSPPRELSGIPLAIYFTVTLLFLFTAKTVVQVPALALLPELAASSHERTLLSAAREQLGNVGDLLGLMLPIALMMAMGATDEGAPAARTRDAFELGAIAIGAIAAVALLFTYAGTCERRRHLPPSTTSIRDVLGVLRSHRPFRAVLAAAALGALSLSFVQSMILYVLTHVMEESDPAVHLFAFVVNVLAAILSYPVWTRLSARVGKASAFRIGLGLSTLAFSTVFLVGPGDYLALALVMAFSGAANVGFWTLLHALNADCAHLDAAMHGTPREGLFMGFSALVKKLAIAGAAAGVGVGLSVIGYEEGVAPSLEVVARLKWLFALPTTALALSALYLFRRYDERPERSGAREGEPAAALAR